MKSFSMEFFQHNGINYQDIIFCCADRCYTFLFLTNDRKKILSKNIKHVEIHLPLTTFYRCHKSYLVNRIYIIKIDANKKEIILSCNKRIPISTRKLLGTLCWFYQLS